MELLSEHGCFGGLQRFYRHDSAEVGLPMRFAVYLPPQAVAGRPLPLLTYLAGLTCTEETFTMKAGAQRVAATLGLALLMPDTSPRGAGLPGETDAWDFGVGAGFYSERLGIFGHSMGGHGALTLALRHPGRFASVSAFAPIAAPTRCPWGRKAFAGYLGVDTSRWREHDASELMAGQSSAPYPRGILIDQGLADRFLAEQLYPEAFEAACRAVGQPLTLRRHAGYDHGYYFIASFVEDHLRCWRGSKRSV